MRCSEGLWPRQRRASPTIPVATNSAHLAAACPPRHRIADDEVVARDRREPAEVDAVGEAVAAGGEALVAAGRDGERVGDCERLGRLLPQLDQHATEGDAMKLHLD